MKELFAPYHLALLAKEKGFDEECLGWYRQPNGYDASFLGHTEGELCLSNVAKGFLIAKGIRAPLYQQLIDWFREKHNIVLEVRWEGTSEIDSWDYRITILGKTICSSDYRIIAGNLDGDSFEEVRDVAIEEGFKLI